MDRNNNSGLWQVMLSQQISVVKAFFKVLKAEQQVAPTTCDRSRNHKVKDFDPSSYHKVQTWHEPLFQP